MYYHVFKQLKNKEMEIRLDDYLMEVDKEGGYNLYALSIGKKGSVEGKETRSILGYNMNFERCLSRIIHNNISSIENTLDLRSFLELYKTEVTRIHELAKNIQ